MTTETNDLPWYAIHDNIVLLAHYLADRGDDAKDVAYAIEKPHKYEDEYNAARAALDAEHAVHDDALRTHMMKHGVLSADLIDDDPV